MPVDFKANSYELDDIEIYKLLLDGTIPLTKYKLHTASKLFGRSAIKYIISAYPDIRIRPWQFKQDKVPSCYWTIEENRLAAIKHLIEVELKWSTDDIREKLCWDVIVENGLGTLRTYYPSISEIVSAAYPKIFKEWELQH